MAVPDPQSISLYRGRFAPSPTGPLHAGSVLAALASYLDARSRSGVWLVRIEDLDPPRESKQAATEILRTLEALALTWDEAVVYQSQRTEAYEEALEQLDSQQLVYACRCSRQKLTAHGSVYPGWCRALQLPRAKDTALRCCVPGNTLESTVEFSDRLQGPYTQRLTQDVGDFVIRRRDGLFAYQLAVVVDDAWQGITDIVRGIDLIDSTPRQIYLQQMLGVAVPGFTLPSYAHVPVVTNAQGQKLGKQQYAEAVDPARPGPVLFRALQRLQQNPESGLATATPKAILAWAIAHWQPANLSGIKQIPEIEGSAATAV